MPLIYFILIVFCGPPGWIIAAIIYYGRSNRREQQRTRQVTLDAAYIASGRTPPTRAETLAAARAAWDALTPMQKLLSNGRP